MSKGSRFDSRLFLYQSLLELPAQVLMLDIYEKLGERDTASYAVMTLLNAGSAIACVKLGSALYETLHKKDISGSSDTEYYVSPFVAHTYDAEFTAYENNVNSGNGQGNPLAEFLDRSPAYSKRYMQLSYAQLAAKSAYGAMSASTSNPLAAVAYGVSQPLCVLLKDAGVLK